MTSPESDCNPDVLCVTSGVICDARVVLHQLYETDHSEERMSDDRESNVDDAQLDGMKLRLKLGENATAARMLQCDGMINDMCPIREQQNNSPLRTMIVRGIRKSRQALTMNRERA